MGLVEVFKLGWLKLELFKALQLYSENPSRCGPPWRRFYFPRRWWLVIGGSTGSLRRKIAVPVVGQIQVAAEVTRR